MTTEPSDKATIPNDAHNATNSRKFPLAVVLKIFGAILAVAILILMIIWAGGIEKILDALDEIQSSVIFIVLIVYLLGWVARGLRWQLILRNIGIKISLYDAISLNFIGNTYNLILPAKLGDTARVLGVKNQMAKNDEALAQNNNTNGRHIAKNLSSVVVDRFLDFGAVIVLLFLTLPFLQYDNLPEGVKWLLYLSPLILVMAIIVLIILYKFRHQLPLLSRFPAKFRKFVVDTLEGFGQAYKMNKRLPVLIVYSLIIWVIDSLIAFLFFEAIYASNPKIFVLIIFGIMVANLTKTIPFTPGGIGTYEVAFTTVLALANVPITVSASVALIDHLFKNLFTAIFGVLFGLTMGLSPAKLARSKTIDKIEKVVPVEEKEHNQ